jgi:signal transduction histidine kinase
MYVVAAGRVAVLKRQGDGRSALLAYRGPGDILGEMGSLCQAPRSATVVATEDTDLLRLDQEALAELIATVPAISQTMLCVLSERLRAADIARTLVVQEEQNLARQLERRVTEADRLAELARLRQQTIDLIVHDLRSPLTVIRASLDVLQESLPTELHDTRKQVVGVAQRSTDRLLSLVEHLLHAARQEVLGVTLHEQPVDLLGLLQCTLDAYLSAAGSSGIELCAVLPQSLPELVGDSEQLERVVGNLLDNAISYTPAGGAIRLAAEQCKEEVCVSVTDSGPGVPIEYRDHIFERFARVPGSKGRRRGFGLGLYLCRQVVQAHGGRIWVEDGPGGVGSRFVFILPIGRRHEH